MSEIEEKRVAARKRLLAVLPSLSLALTEANVEIAHTGSGGTPILGVGYVKPEGGGRLVARIDIGPFLDDLVLILGFESMREVIARALAGPAPEKSEEAEAPR